MRWHTDRRRGGEGGGEAPREERQQLVPWIALERARWRPAREFLWLARFLLRGEEEAKPRGWGVVELMPTGWPEWSGVE